MNGEYPRQPRFGNLEYRPTDENSFGNRQISRMRLLQYELGQHGPSEPALDSIEPMVIIQDGDIDVGLIEQSFGSSKDVLINVNGDFSVEEAIAFSKQIQAFVDELLLKCERDILPHDELDSNRPTGVQLWFEGGEAQ